MNWHSILSGLKVGGKAVFRFLVEAMEAQFGGGTGPVKMATLLGMLQPLIEAAARAGKIPGLPTPEELKSAAEAEVQAWKQDSTTAPTASGAPEMPVESAPAGPTAGNRVHVLIPAGVQIIVGRL